MKFPLFWRRAAKTAIERAKADDADKLLADSLRAMGQVFQRLAEYVEAQRLTRAGYEQQDRYLKRVEPREPGS